MDEDNGECLEGIILSTNLIINLYFVNIKIFLTFGINEEFNLISIDLNLINKG